MEETDIKPQSNKQRKSIKVLKWFCGIVTGIILSISATLYFFQDHICKLVLDEVNNQLIEPINVADVDLVFWGSFPTISVDLKDVYIHDKFSTGNISDTMLFAKNIRMQFNPIDLWNEKYDIKNIEISSGVLKLKSNEAGDSNYDIVKSSKSEDKSPLNLKLKHILIDNLRLSYYNGSTFQHYKTTIQQSHLSGNFSDENYTLNAECSMFINHLKSSQVVLLANKKANFKIDIKVNNKLGTIKLPKAQINIEGLPFLIDGSATRDSILISIQSKNILLTDLANELSLDEDNKLKKFKGDGEVYFNLNLNGSISSSAPLNVNCNFGIKNGSLTEPANNLTASDISLVGNYSNEGGAEEEYLKLERVNFKTAGGPFSGDLIIKNFKNPTFQGKANGSVDLRIADGIFRFPLIDKILGRVNINTSFLLKQSKEVFSVQDCSGAIQLSNIHLKMENDKRTFDQINGRISLMGSELGIETTTLKINDTDLKINGSFRNIFNYLSGKGALNANIILNSNTTNIGDLGSTTKSQKTNGERIYALPENIQATIDLKVGQLIYEKHTFSNLSGLLQINGRRLNFPQISCLSAGSELSGSLAIAENTPEMFYLSAAVFTKNLHIKPLFKEWNNFEQSVITDHNITGNAEGHLDFKAPFDLRSGVILKGIQSTLSLKVNNGHLKNVESFKDIVSSMRSKSGKLVLGNTNIDEFEKKLNDLSFETLENTIVISNGTIKIPKMKIVSSAMEMDISGTHSFENIIDYRFAFNLRDIKQKAKHTQFGEIIDDETGFRVFMRMYGALEDPTIEWDKKAKNEQFKITIQEEKQEVKEILKTEFGLFKKDSTVQGYAPKEIPKEEIKINFNPKIKGDKAPVNNPVKDEKPNKDPKIKKNLQKWKGEQDEDNEDVIVVGKSKGK